MKTAKIAVIGAGGNGFSNLGREIMQVLAERGVIANHVTALAVGNAPGMVVGFGDEDELPIGDARAFDFTQMEIVISTDKDAAPLLRRAAKQCALLVDLSGAFLGDGDVAPLLPQLINETQAPPKVPSGIVACPSPLASMLARVLAPLHKVAGVERVTVASYQGVSTAGRAAMDELFTQTRAVFVNDPLVKEQFAKQIAFNVIPQTATLRENGFTDDEFRLAVELKQLLGAKLKVVATCAYVPVFLGTGIAVTVELGNELGAPEAAQLLRAAPKTYGSVTLVDQRVEEGLITPAETAGEDGIYISRLREDATVDNGLALWISGDALRRHAVDAVALVEAWATQDAHGNAAPAGLLH